MALAVARFMQSLQPNHHALLILTGKSTKITENLQKSSLIIQSIIKSNSNHQRSISWVGKKNISKGPNWSNYTNTAFFFIDHKLWYQTIHSDAITDSPYDDIIYKFLKCVVAWRDLYRTVSGWIYTWIHISCQDIVASIWYHT